MRGLLWCIWIAGLGLPVTLAGLALNWDRLMLIGTSMLATVVVGWPVLLLAGELHDMTARSGRTRFARRR